MKEVSLLGALMAAVRDPPADFGAVRAAARRRVQAKPRAERPL